MCWSFQVSLSFTIIESIMALLILIRSRRSHDYYVQAQWRLLPLLCSIIIVELSEAIIWYQHEYNGDTLKHITDASRTDYIPSTMNVIATAMIGYLVIPIQPFLFIWPCRMAGDQKTKDIMFGPQFLSLIYAFSMVILRIFSEFDTVHFPTASYETMEHSNYNTFMFPKTCSWIGKSGHHLHWTFDMVDAWYAPTAFSYCLLLSSVVLAKPFEFGSGIITFCFGMFAAQVWYFDGSFEAGSVWCFSAMAGFIYFLIQPYIFPIHYHYKEKDVNCMGTEINEKK